MSSMAERFVPIPHLSDSDKRRFWAKVNVKGEDDCWNWLAGLYDGRYGRFSVKSTISLCAHRVSYYIDNSTDPGIKLVCHSCNNTFCVNPKHLYLDDNSGNQKYSHLCNPLRQVGSNNPATRLTESVVLEIRRLNDSTNLSYAEIGKKFGVSKYLVYQIVWRKSWRHI